MGCSNLNEYIGYYFRSRRTVGYGCGAKRKIEKFELNKIYIATKRIRICLKKLKV